MNLDCLTFPIVQISLDVTSLDEALETAAIAVDAGVDWLEAGTPLLLAEGLRAVQQLRRRFPDHPIVADIRLQGSFSHNYPVWERVIHLLDRGVTDAIVGLTSPLDHWRDAFEAMHEGRVIKSVLIP
jgi:D-arabinose 1-dehydrogenase-like Zn-dependent alcohol dehydrogenase